MKKVAKPVSITLVLITVAGTTMMGDNTKAMQSSSWYDDPYPPMQAGSMWIAGIEATLGA